MSIDTTFDALASDRRRRVLALVSDSMTTVDTVARQLAASQLETDPGSVPDEQLTDYRIALVHTDLPLLEAAGLLEWDREGETISRADALPIDVETIEQSGDRDWDPVFSALADGHRRAVLAILEEVDDPLTVETLAQRLAKRVEAPRETVTIALHHRHLPLLVEAGLVDRVGRRVRYGGEDLEVSLDVSGTDTEPGPFLARTVQ